MTHIHVARITDPDLVRKEACQLDSSSDILASTSNQAFAQALAIRKSVFVDEQKVSAAAELDNYETDCWHWIAFLQKDKAADSDCQSMLTITTSNDKECDSEKGTAMGTVRLVPPHIFSPSVETCHVKYNGAVVEKPMTMLPWRALGITPETRAFMEQQEKVRYADVAQEIEHLPLVAKVSRLAVLPKFRGRPAEEGKIGQILIKQLEDDVCNDLNNDKNAIKEPDGCRKKQVLLLVHAQLSALGFWQKAGYEQEEQLGEWEEEGIRHCAMWKMLSLD